MRRLQWMLAGAAVGVIAVAFRDFDRGRWLAPALPHAPGEPNGTEPVLGYDGMDQETLLEWLPEATLDRDTVEEVMRYEEANLGREPVLSMLREMLD